MTMKTDYFATFLDTLNRGLNTPGPGAGGSGTPARPVAPPAGVVPAPATPASTGIDDLVRALAAKGGSMTVNELMQVAAVSIGMLLGLLQQLQSFGLVKVAGTTVELTDEGQQVAHMATPPATEI